MIVEKCAVDLKSSRLVLVLTLLFGMQAIGSAEVTLDVITDRTITPIAELASTQTDPDVVVVSNGVIEITLVPNRGRVLAELRTVDGTEFVSFLDQPIPFVGDDDVVAVEFGGFYSTVPWNTRVRQPYNLDYEILSAGPDRVEIAITGMDIITRVGVEWRIILEEGSSAAHLNAEYTNHSTRSSQTIDLEHRLHFQLGGGWMDRRFLLTNQDDATVRSSEANWLGVAGSTIDLDLVRSGWTGDGDYCVESAVDSHGDSVAWFDRRSRSALVWSWGGDADFPILRICGTTDFVQVALTGASLNIGPGESQMVRTVLTTRGGLRRTPRIEELTE